MIFTFYLANTKMAHSVLQMVPTLSSLVVFTAGIRHIKNRKTLTALWDGEVVVLVEAFDTSCTILQDLQLMKNILFGEA